MFQNIFNIVFLFNIIKCDANMQSLIIGGTQALEEEFPYIVSVRQNYTHLCTGTIINEYHILTAAHAVVGISGLAQKLSIQYGLTSIYTSTNNTIDVSNVIIHEDFSPWDNYANDIAIIRLKNPLKFSRWTKPVKLANPSIISILSVVPRRKRKLNRRYQKYTQRLKTPAAGIGWGYPYTGANVMHDLEKVDLIVYTDADCKKDHGRTVNTTIQICAGAPTKQKITCSEASGAPLMVLTYQIGIMSWSVKPCTVRSFLGVWTKVIYYYKWIINKSMVH